MPEVRLSSWTLAQDTDKPKFAEHYHDSTDITSPEGTRGKYTRDSCHARQRNAVRPSQFTSRVTSLHLDDPDPVRKRHDRRQSWRNPRLLCLCFTGLRWEEALGTGAPRLAGAARRGGA